MSQFTGSHLVTAFDSATSQALSGQRLAKCRYKTTTKQAAKFPSVCVSVPSIADSTISENMVRLMPYVKSMVENAQDGVIRSLYESSYGALTQVSDSDISMNAIIGFLEAESTGGRLTKEFIEAWFTGLVHDTVYLLIAEKLGFTGEGDFTPEQDAVIGKHVSGYKGMFAALAGGKTFYSPNQVRSLRKVLELSGVDADGETGQKLDGRLAKMLEVKPIEELLEL